MIRRNTGYRLADVFFVITKCSGSPALVEVCSILSALLVPIDCDCGETVTLSLAVLVG